MRELDPRSSLTKAGILQLWLPLAATWLVMALEGPLMQSVIARLSEPKLNLAALGVALSLMVIADSPILSIITAANALVEDRVSYFRIRNFTFVLSLFLTLFMLTMLEPAIFSFVAEKVLSLPPDVRKLSRDVSWILLTAPFFVSYRRFYQGILIREGLTHKVGACTSIRLITICSALFLLATYTEFPGAKIAAIALSLAFIVEAISVRIIAHRLIKQLVHRDVGTLPVSYYKIAQFYLPLALTGIIVMATQPLLTCFIARAREPLESLAVFPVVNGFSFVLGCLIFAMQEVIISQLGNSHEHFYRLREFLFVLTGVVFVGQALIVLTPMSQVILGQGYGLNQSLIDYALVPLAINSVGPLLMAVSTWLRSIVIHGANTIAVSRSSVVELLLLAFVTAGLIAYTPLSGVSAAIIGMVASRFFGTLLLIPAYVSLRRASTK